MAIRVPQLEFSGLRGGFKFRIPWCNFCWI